jgi:DNA-directed RNA polymerase subunit RPC12/RpoP/energy-coupling factor transporter ATP-binding protein EcfA2
MPFTCEICGLRSHSPDQMPAAGEKLRCTHCGSERPFFRPPLLIVTGSTAVGKSTLCARLAGTIPDAILLDADIHADDLISVVPPNNDYLAFWRSMMRLAHELTQNRVAVVYFSTMLPEQVLANDDLLGYFQSVRFLCLTCPRDVLRSRIAGRDGREAAARLEMWLDFNDAVAKAAQDLPIATAMDASGAVNELEKRVQAWLLDHLTYS